MLRPCRTTERHDEQSLTENVSVSSMSDQNSSLPWVRVCNGKAPFG